MKVECIETRREILEPGPLFVILMDYLHTPQKEWNYSGTPCPLRGKTKQYLMQSTLRIIGNRYVDGEFTTQYIQYL